MRRGGRLLVPAALAGALLTAPGIAGAGLRVAQDRVTADLEGSSLGKAVAALAAQSGVRIVVDVQGDEHVTTRFRDLPLEEAVRRLLRDRALVFLYSATGLTEVRALGAGGRSGDASAVPPLDPARLAAAGDAAMDETDSVADVEDDDAVGAGLAPLADVLLAQDDAAAREVAARGLGRAWDARAAAPLARALANDEDASVREAAAQALGQTWSPEAVEPLAQALLADPSRAVREAAAEALGDLDEPGATWALVQALGDPDSLVREAAARALGRLGDPEAVGALADVAARDGEGWVRDAARGALRLVGASR